MSTMWYNHGRKILYFKKPKPKFIMNKDLSCYSKNLVYTIEYKKCKEIYIGWTKFVIPGYHSPKAT